MSWDACLTTPSGRAQYGDWNYTHNCNGMIEAALDRAGVELADTKQPFWAAIREKAAGPDADFPMGRHAWWDLLDGRTGAEGRQLLDAILKQFAADPAHYRAMNPPNGWGDFDRLVHILADMRDRIPDEEPSVWSVHG